MRDKEQYDFWDVGSFDIREIVGKKNLVRAKGVRETAPVTSEIRLIASKRALARPTWTRVGELRPIMWLLGKLEDSALVNDAHTEERIVGLNERHMFRTVFCLVRMKHWFVKRLFPSVDYRSVNWDNNFFWYDAITAFGSVSSRLVQSKHLHNLLKISSWPEKTAMQPYSLPRKPSPQSGRVQ